MCKICNTSYVEAKKGLRVSPREKRLRAGCRLHVEGVEGIEGITFQIFL